MENMSVNRLMRNMKTTFLIFDMTWESTFEEKHKNL